MQIRALNLAISQPEIFAALAQIFAEIRDLKVVVDDSGITVSGEYPAWIPIPFSTLWVPQVAEGNLVLSFTVLRVIGINVSDFRPLVLKALQGANQPWLAIGPNDAITVMVPILLATIKQIQLTFTLQLATTQQDMLILVG